MAAVECVAARRASTLVATHRRAYCYRVLTRRARSPHERRRALHWTQRLDLGALRECARALQGTHDFTAFTPTGTRHVRFERDVYAAAWHERGGGLLEFAIEADSFMRNMNRVLVGTMLEVAQGRRSVAQFSALLTGRPRHEAGITAPRTACTSWASATRDSA